MLIILIFKLINYFRMLLLQVVILDLSINNFKKVPDLSQFKALRSLNLSYNVISTLDTTSLTGLDQLQVLDLSHNAFQKWMDIDLNAISTATSLSELDLSYNALHNLPEIQNPLKSNSLQILRIANCSINNLYSDAFGELRNLKELYMARNQLPLLRTSIKHGTLEILDMSQCGLKWFYKEAFEELPALQKLILSKNNELKNFDSSSDSLRKLELSQCNLDNIPGGKLPKLVYLNLNENNLRRVLSNSFENITEVEVLNLSSAGISKVEENAFNGLNNLRVLDLSYNTISKIDPKTFNTNFHLEKLLLSHNYLSKVTRLDSESLKYLDLSNCEIVAIGRESLSQMPSLQVINLSKNLISRLPDELEGESVNTINLSYCHITGINNRTFMLMESLRQLDLSGNRLTSDVKVSYFPHSETWVRLDNNPWRCECDADQKELYEHLTFLNNIPPRLGCQSPVIYKGMSWTDACEEIWYPPNSHKDNMWWYTLVLILSMIVFFCVICSVRRAYQIKENRRREQEEQERAEARERLRRMRQQQREIREIENRNAPDPRESQRPPSYTEALRMATPQGSYLSLAGSRQSLSASRGNLRGSNQDVSRKSRKRRKKREKSESSDELKSNSRSRSESNRQQINRQRQSVATTDSSDSEPVPRAALESDF